MSFGHHLNGPLLATTDVTGRLHPRLVRRQCPLHRLPHQQGGRAGDCQANPSRSRRYPGDSRPESDDPWHVEGSSPAGLSDNRVRERSRSRNSSRLMT